MPLGRHKVPVLRGSKWLKTHAFQIPTLLINFPVPTVRLNMTIL